MNLRRCFGFISRHPHLVSSYSLIEDEEAAAGSFNSSFVMLQKQKWDRGLIFSAEKTENSNFDSESHTTSSRWAGFGFNTPNLFIPDPERFNLAWAVPFANVRDRPKSSIWKELFSEENSNKSLPSSSTY
jgi:hypothetical protein